MKKIVKQVDEKRGIVQITTVDERWYARPVVDQKTRIPTGYEYVPSVTWIAGFYPKGVGFYKWLATTGWDEAQAIKEAAGDKGSKVHHVITMLLEGLKIAMEDKIVNPSTGQPEALTLEEYEAVLAFAAWHEATKPILVAQDFTVWNREHGYAGTVDAVFLVQGVLWLMDFKTSKAVWPSQEIQVSAYRHTPEVEAIMKRVEAPEVEAIMKRVEASEVKLGILQIGYKRNKDGFKLTEVQDQMDLFLAAKKIWAKETAGQVPSQRDYPVSVKLAVERAPQTNGQQAATDPIAAGVPDPAPDLFSPERATAKTPTVALKGGQR